MNALDCSMICLTFSSQNGGRAELTAEPSPHDALGVDHYVTSDRFLDHRVTLYGASRRDPLVPGYVDLEARRVRGVPR
jgi:dTDP-4-dehydrorhamnose reductase